MSENASDPSRVDRQIPASLDSLYQEVILDHYRRPRNKGPRIDEARFAGRGCSISLASASMLTQRLKGRTIPEALELSQNFTRLLHGDASVTDDADLGDLRALSGVSKFPVRIKCALLGFNCLDELVGKAPDDSAEGGQGR
jgi:nitrogen fixation NifU-like protein